MAEPAGSAPPFATAGAAIAPGYRVLAPLHRGSRLDIYDAWSEERECRVVIKTLRPDRALDRAGRAALLREGALLRRLTHPHIVRAYETVMAADPARPAVVMEVLTGETLGHLLERSTAAGRRLPVRDVALLGVQLVSAVSYLHRHGLLHLDLKPANIVIEAARVKLIDLSIARAPGRGRPGSGTHAYMAPEQVTGSRLTPATDVWGTGVVLFEAITGRLPFVTHADSSGTDRYPQMNALAPAVVSLRRVPAPLSAILDACLVADPDHRPLLAELAAVLGSIGEAADAL